VSDPKNRQRVFWLVAIGCVLLLSLLFISVFAPSTPSTNDPVLRPSDTSAESPSNDEARSSTAGFSLGGGQAVSLVWRLGLVAVIIGVSIVGLRWWARKTNGPSSSSGFLRVVDTLAISNGRTIHLVALGDRVIAIGATAQQLTYLNELTDDEAAAVRSSLLRPETPTIPGFAAELFHSMRRPKSPASPTDLLIGEDL
jgi:flagellar biogenesis protein FliO